MGNLLFRCGLFLQETRTWSARTPVSLTYMGETVMSVQNKQVLLLTTAPDDSLYPVTGSPNNQVLIYCSWLHEK